MLVWIVMLAQIGPAADAPPRGLPVRLPGTLPGCTSAETDDIVVCGGRRERYRLPLPIDKASLSDRRVRGEAAAPLAAITPSGACGLFAGQRACGKAEAARYGYGAGRDPVTILGRLGEKLLNPDAETGAPTEVP